MDSTELKQRTKALAHRCTKLAMSLPQNVFTRYVQDQLFRSATSVAANYRAACLAQSKAAFVSKLSIVIEEADEVIFWIEFIVEEHWVTAKKVAALMAEAGELTAIFIAARKTAKPRK